MIKCLSTRIVEPVTGRPGGAIGCEEGPASLGGDGHRRGVHIVKFQRRKTHQRIVGSLNFANPVLRLHSSGCALSRSRHRFVSGFCSTTPSPSSSVSTVLDIWSSCPTWPEYIPKDLPICTFFKPSAGPFFSSRKTAERSFDIPSCAMT